MKKWGDNKGYTFEKIWFSALRYYDLMLCFVAAPSKQTKAKEGRRRRTFFTTDMGKMKMHKYNITKWNGSRNKQQQQQL